MLPTTSKVLIVVAALAMIDSAHAQTSGPSTLRSSLMNQFERDRIDTLYSDRPMIVLGWNYGAAMRGTNEDLLTNTYHCDFPFRWDPTAIALPQFSLAAIPDRTRLIMAPAWNIHINRWQSDVNWYWLLRQADQNGGRSQALQLDVGKGSTTSLIEAMGMRFHPELDMTDTVGFTPRAGDTQHAVWGFRSKVHGTTPTSTTDPNYQRFVLSAAGITGWTTVLDESWPQQRFGEWQKDTIFDQMSAFNSHLMYLGINVRRVHDSDVVQDTVAVLRLRIHYQLTDSAGTSGLVNFDSLPHPTATPVRLPATFAGGDRGIIHPLQVRQVADSVEEMVVTRQMIPRGDSVTRDVTVLGHFRLCNTQHGSVPRDQNPKLRSRWNLMKNYTDSERDTGNWRIVRMWVEVEYAGHTDIAIDWVQIGTENFTWLTQGQHDGLIREGYVAMTDSLRRFNTVRFGDSTDADRLRLWRWYNRDEGPEAYWEGMGYTHRLFDERTTVELDLRDNQERFIYLTGITTLWDGATSKIERSVCSPYYRRGHGGSSSVAHRYYGFQSGVDDIVFGTDDRVDYDLHWGGSRSQLPPAGRSWDTLTTALPPPLDPEPHKNGAYPIGLDQAGGLQAEYERYRWERHERPQYLFNDATPWMANIWLSPDVKVHDSGSVLQYLTPVSHGPRFLTGEEATLQAWSHIILGAKGLLYYWGAGQDSATQHQHVIVNDFLSPGIGYGPVKDTLTRYQWNGTWVLQQPSPLRTENANTRTAFLHGLAARDAAAGPDWLDSNNCTGLWQAMNDNVPTLAVTLDSLYGTRPTGAYYLGWRSVRSALQTVHDVVNRGADVLARLHLRAWYSKGFRSWKLGDTALLSRFVDVGRLRSRHPYRDSARRRPTFETADSMFVEITLLQDGTRDMDSVFVLGILNRRCNPFDYDSLRVGLDTNHVDDEAFNTYHDHWLRIKADASPGKRSRYLQAGARQIEVPFKYSRGPGDYRLLHVTEIGAASDDSLGITVLDTIIGQDKPLRINFMPGEGKMLRVQVLPSQSDTLTRGFLDHANQRKLVAFPTIANNRRDTSIGDTVTSSTEMRFWRCYLAGDTMYYHAVYHRRVDGDLHVFYRRSTPTLSSFEKIDWEPEIDLSLSLMEQIDSAAPESVTADGCAYPSLVVRPFVDNVEPADSNDPLLGQTLPSNVYVVFACKDCPTEEDGSIVVAYRTFPADVSHAAQVAAVQNSSAWVVDRFPIQPGMLQDSALHAWGTPVINAAARGNFLAWSRFTLGIRTKFLKPQSLTARSMDGITTLKVASPASDEVHATHPSLNSYSRLNLGEHDAALLWQEGSHTELGTHIYYTRLRASAAGVVTNLIADSIKDSGAFSDQWGEFVPGRDSTILHIGGPSQQVPPAPDDDLFVRNRTVSYPTIYRNLSDYGLDADNSRYTTGLVHSKAERMFWETQAEYGTPISLPYPLGSAIVWTLGRREIARRAIDVNDFAARDTAAKPTLWGRGPYLIWSDAMHLLAPNVAQGEHYGEDTTTVNDMGEWYSDSVNVLNFHAEPVDPGPPSLWHLTYGWLYYGTSVNHELDSLTGVVALEQPGRYPQLAARYSMSFNRGWQRNRRITEGIDAGRAGVPTYLTTPTIRTNAQEFFKGFKPQHMVARTFVGWAGPEDERWTVGGISVDGSKTVLDLSMTPSGEYRSVETGIDPISDLDVVARIDPGVEGVTLSIERRSDGARLNVPIAASAKAGTTAAARWRTVADPGERFTFRLAVSSDRLHPVKDLGILAPTVEDLDKRLSPSDGVVIGTLDLRTMQARPNEMPSIVVQPVPVNEKLTVILDRPIRTGIEIVDLAGRTIISTSTGESGIAEIDVTMLQPAAYSVRAKVEGYVLHAPFIVMRP